ncbi:hypothetical protein Tco_1395337 [Tanacetum coccineum]
MACVSSVSFSFNINGQVSGHVTPTRGLHQGDPILPYTFVMCAKVLSSMIRKSVMEGNLIDDIHKSLNVYWWGDGVKENPIRWCKCERMCVLKFRGGLGFCHLGLFNRPLLAKQVWRLITSPTTLAARTLKAHYFPRSSFFDAKIGYRPSYIWRSFLSVKDIVHKGCKWNIDNGRSVNIWNDFWVDEHRSLGPKPNNCDVDQHNNPGGRFSCKSAYLLALEADEDMDRITISDDLIEFWRVVWKARDLSKVKLFMWRV